MKAQCRRPGPDGRTGEEVRIMRKDGAATGRGGSGLVMVGVGVAIALAAITALVLRQHAALTEDQLTSLVPPAETAAEPQVRDAAAPPAATEESAPDAGAPDAQEEAAAPQSDAVAEPVESASAQAEADSGETEPTIDEVRLDADGMAVVAGRAAPGSDVEVIVDGEVVAKGVADAGGSFAALGTVAPDAKARVLSLRAQEQGKAAVVSRDEVIITPTPEPKEIETEQETGGAQTAALVPSDGTAPAAESVQTDPDTTDAANAGDTETLVATVTPTPADSEPSEKAQPGASESGEDATSQVSAPTATVEAPVAPPAVPEPPASAQVALLKSTEEGVELLQTAPLQPARIVLDTIGYSDSGVVQLSGRAGSDAVEVRVYLDNRAIITLPVEEQGAWRGDVPNVDTGIYTLRVDAVDAKGSVTSRLETPFKREALDVLAAATDADAGPVSAVTVQTGDTLWAIARDRYGEGVLYVKVFDANRSSIRDPDLIYPGQVFDLPSD